MKKLFIFLTLIAFNCWAQSGRELKPFATDYCTLYVEGTRSQPNLWRHCCVEHDLYFWCGGNLEDKKATDIVGMDLTKVSESLDYFIIATANSQPQLNALERNIAEKLLEIGVRPSSIEGPSPRWVLVNLGAIIVHLMTQEARDFYDLEGLWADADRITFN